MFKFNQNEDAWAGQHMISKVLSFILNDILAHLIISNLDDAEDEEDDDDGDAEDDAFLDEDVDDGALDILDLTAAAPSAPEPIDLAGPIHSF